MDLDRSSKPPCWDERDRCTNDSDGDGDCQICMSPFWLHRRRRSWAQGVTVNVDVDPFGEVDL